MGRGTAPDVDRLVVEYRPLALALAKKRLLRLPRSMRFLADDLASAALFGLVSAARRYDATTGAKFGAFAAMRIHGAISDALRREELLPRGDRARRYAEHGPALPTMMRGRLAQSVIGEIPVPTTPATEFELAETRDFIAELVRRLPPRARQITVRYWLKEESPTAIAREQGVSVQAVHQSVHRAVRLLREIVAGDDDRWNGG